MQRRLIITLGLIFFLIPLSASAHFLKTDNNIGVVLHIDPDDDPAAGEPTTLLFDTKDKEGKYQPAECDCQAVIKQEGKVLETVTATGTDAASTSAVYTFPATGVYQVFFQGAPTSPEAFQSFSVSWDVRVDHVSGAAKPNVFRKLFEGHGVHFALIGLATVGMLGYIFMENRREQERKSKASK